MEKCKNAGRRLRFFVYAGYLPGYLSHSTGSYFSFLCSICALRESRLALTPLPSPAVYVDCRRSLAAQNEEYPHIATCVAFSCFASADRVAYPPHVTPAKKLVYSRSAFAYLVAKISLYIASEVCPFSSGTRNSLSQKEVFQMQATCVYHQ